MIPEIIERLLLSSNLEGRAIGFQLAKKQGLEGDIEFQRFVYSKVRLVSKFVDREFLGRSTNAFMFPYKSFKIRDVPSWEYED